VSRFYAGLCYRTTTDIDDRSNNNKHLCIQMIDVGGPLGGWQVEGYTARYLVVAFVSSLGVDSNDISVG
jgi:hypothetical protein